MFDRSRTRLMAWSTDTSRYRYEQVWSHESYWDGDQPCIRKDASMFSALDVSTSALVAQRIRLNTISGNIANMSSMRNENGELKPFQARYPVFQTDGEHDRP